MELLQSVLDQHLADACRVQTISCTQSDQQLDTIYEGLDDIFFSKGGFIIPKKETIRIDATGGSASYGEVQAAGIDHIMQ